MIDLMTAIQSLRPNAELVIRGDEIEWIDSDNKIDGFFISMKLTKENYVAL